MEIESIFATHLNYFFLLKNGNVYGSGEAPFLGIGKASEDGVYIPEKIDFSSSFVPFHGFPSSNFIILCSEFFDKCLGFGDNSHCCFAGCDVDEFLYLPTSIFQGNLSNFISSSSSVEIKTIFVSVSNTLILLQNDTNSLDETNEILFGVGNSEFGILSTTNEYQDWIQINTKSLGNSKIKFASFLSVEALFLITENDQWFFSGANKYSTCFTHFLPHPSLSEAYITSNLSNLPNDRSCSCNGYTNELIGKNIKDFHCSYDHCVSLTNENRLYSWGDYDDCIGLLGRTYDTPEYVPEQVNITILESINDNNNIESIFIQGYFTFVLVSEEDDDTIRNKQRLFGFGEDGSFGIEETSAKYMIEVFANYNFTKYLRLSKGNFQQDSIMLHDSSLCWGKYSNESTSCDQFGTCYSFDECECFDPNQYTGKYCEETYCFDVLSSDDDVCSGNGICKDYDTCVCNKGWEGKNCAEASTSFLGTVVGVLAKLVFASILLLFFLFCALLCCFVLIMVAGIPYFFLNKDKRTKKSRSSFNDLNYSLLEENEDDSSMLVMAEVDES